MDQENVKYILDDAELNESGSTSAAEDDEVEHCVGMETGLQLPNPNVEKSWVITG